MAIKDELKLFVEQFKLENGRIPTQNEIIKGTGRASKTIKSYLVEGVDYAKPLTKLEAARLGGQKPTGITKVNPKLVKELKDLKVKGISLNVQTSPAGSKSFKVTFDKKLNLKNIFLPATKENLEKIKTNISEVIDSDNYNKNILPFQTSEEKRKIRRYKEASYKRKDPFRIYYKLSRYKGEKFPGSLSKDVVVDENARKIVSDKYGDLSSKFDLSKQLIESDPDIISKVEAQIKEMRMNNELEKDKMNSLRSIDTLEKLTREFLNFKQITSMQMQTIGGGGGVQLLDMDDVNISTKSDGFILKYNASTERMDFVSADSGLITGLTADGSNNIIIAGNLTVQGSTTTVDSTTIEIQNSFKFEGATADGFETDLTTVDPTADRTIRLPNASGTIVLQDSTDTLTNKSIDSDNNTITNIVNADIKAGAAIAFSKMADLTASRALVSDSNGDVSISDVTSTEIGHLDGVSSNVQSQLDAKATNAFAIAQAVALG